MNSIADFKSHFYSGNELIHLNNFGQALIPDVAPGYACLSMPIIVNRKLNAF